MFSAISRLLGMIDVKESTQTITVQGLPGTGFGKSVTKNWSTSRIATYMFNQLSTSKITFNKFFAVEVVYMLSELEKLPPANGINRRVVRKTIESLQTETWLKNLEVKQPDILDFSQLKQFKKTPLDHQMTFLEHYNDIVPKYDLNGYLLAAKPGAGKTLTGLMLAACLKSDVVVVIAPKNSVYKVWKKTITEEYVKEGNNPWIAADEKPLERGRQFYVFHYEALTKIQDLISMVAGKNMTILIDESHNFNEEKSARTRMLMNFCLRTRCQNILWASGTPIKALGYEVIPFLTTIDPYFNRDTEDRFRKIFGKSSSKAVEILRNRIGMVMFKVEKAEFTKTKPIEEQVNVKLKDPSRFTLANVRKDMSDFIVERMAFYEKYAKYYRGKYDEGVAFYSKLKLSPNDRKDLEVYNRYIAQIIKHYDPVESKDLVVYCNTIERQRIMPSLPQPLRGEFKDARSVVKYLNLKVQGEALGRVLGKRRAECNAALIEHAGLPEIIDNAEKKTVVFSSFVDVIEQTSAYLTKAGYHPLMVHQGTNKNLPAIIDKFGSDPDANPCCATFQSLSTAVPLTMANAVILMNQPFRDFEREQAISRADRIGQDTQVYVYNVLLDTAGEPNISTRAADIVQWSREQVAAIMGTAVVDETAISMESQSDESFDTRGDVVLDIREYGLGVAIEELEALGDIMADDGKFVNEDAILVRPNVRPRSACW